MKENILFVLYKDKPLDNKKTFKQKLKKYAKEINIDNLFIKINNYQIDKYGSALNYFDPNFWEDNNLKGKNLKNVKTKEYRKGNKA